MIRKAVFVQVLLLVGCAYTSTSILPPHIKRIAVPVFSNATFKAGLETMLTDAVIREFLTDGRLEVSSEDRADAILYGRISYYFLDPTRYDSMGRVEEYRIWVLVTISLKDLKDGKVLWTEENMEGQTTFSPLGGSGLSPESEEQAISRVVRKLAKDIVLRTIEGWPRGLGSRIAIPQRP